jgi:hypothetical protein
MTRRGRAVGVLLAGIMVLGLVGASPAAAYDQQARFDQANAFAAGRGTVGIAVLDRETGKLTENGNAHVRIRSASVVKAFVAENLLDRRAHGMALPSRDVALLESMVRSSDDGAMSSLYSRYGGLQIVTDVARKYGLTEVGPPPTPSYWGMFQITAHDIVKFYDGMLDGGLGAADRNYLVGLMRSATPHGSDGFYQFAGIPDALPGQTWGVKQGWMCCQEGQRRLHTTGILGSSNRFAVAVLAQYSSGLSYAYGGETLTGTILRLFPGGVLPPPLATRNPTGFVDAVTEARVGTFRFDGWTVDPDAPTQPLRVHAYVDGRGTPSTQAARARPDVARVIRGAGPNQGFSLEVAVPDGTHEVCLYSINVGDGNGNPRLGCRSVTSRLSPVGVVDVVAAAGLRSVRVTGWVYDRDSPTTATRVHVYVDGRAAAAAPADGDRQGVARAYPAAGAAHGFSTTIVLPSGGRHDVCVYGINVAGTGGGNTRIACRAVTLPRGVIGAVDAASPTSGGIAVAGWAIDSDARARSNRVHVYVDNRVAAGLTADVPRSGVGNVYPDAGAAHGYSGTVPAAPGTHRVCVYGIPLSAGSANQLLGCRIVRV